jgi:hypothetical protein
VDFWTNVSELEEDWHNDELDEASLTSSNVGGGSVAHHGNIKLLSFLHISLVEELVEQQVSPLSTDLVRSERGTDVTSMESNTGDQLLGGLDGFGRGVIDQQLSIFLVLDAKLVEMILEFISQLLHGGHIGKQDCLNKSLFDQLDLRSGELTAEEVILHDIQEFNGLGGMKVLLDVLFAVHLADWRFGDHMVSVIETIMLNIVAKSSNDQR